MSYIAAQGWLAEVFSHLPNILDYCHRRHFSEQSGFAEVNLYVYNEFESRAEFDSLTTGVGRRALKFND